jgi:rfaE bifunctional protein kinase chain/domain
MVTRQGTVLPLRPDIPDRIALEAVGPRVARAKQTGARVGVVTGKFNIMHPGHLRLLRFASENCDVLVVGILPDSAPGVTVTAGLRAEALLAISMVSEVVLMDESIEALLTTFQPDLVVKGKEYAARFNEEATILEAWGGELLFSSGEVLFSSLDLLQREFATTNFSSIAKPSDYPDRHSFTMRKLAGVVKAMSKAKVVVIGDLIVDTYITCDPLGMSQEDPTIVVTPIDRKTFVGGAGIVAAHARGLGADVSFVSVSGADREAAFAADMLKSYGVDAHLIADESRPTTHKQRYRAHNKTLLRVNELRQHGVNAAIAAKLTGLASDLIADADVVLFSDFNYGCLVQPVVDALSEAGRTRGAIMAADSQASSQLSDISRFKGMHFVTPTEREARLALGDFDSGLSVLADNLQRKSGAHSVLITLGGEGLLTYAPDGDAFLVDQLPALNSSPKDVAGAGDSLFTATALALHGGASIWMAAYLGAIAAACQVSRVGNLPLSASELLKELSL